MHDSTTADKAPPSAAGPGAASDGKHAPRWIRSHRQRQTANSARYISNDPHDRGFIPASWQHVGSASPFSGKTEYADQDADASRREGQGAGKGDKGGGTGGGAAGGPSRYGGDLEAQRPGPTEGGGASKSGGPRRRRGGPSIPPTRAEYTDPKDPDITIRWTSRAHRKGVPPQRRRRRPDGSGKTDPETGFTGLIRRERNLLKAFWKVRWWGWDVGDISWWIAVLFIFGSACFAIEGTMFFFWFNRTAPAFVHTQEALAFIGGTTFVLGSYFDYVESLNPAFSDWDGAFGYEVEELKRASLEEEPIDRTGQYHTLGKRRRHFGSHAPDASVFEPPQNSSGSNQRNKDSSATASESSDEATLAPSSPPPNSKQPQGSSSPQAGPSPNEKTGPSSPSSKSQPQQKPKPRAKWKWWGLPPPGKRLELGFLATSIQLFGAVAFQVAVLCGLPGVLPTTPGPGEAVIVEVDWLAAYWAMQIIGSPCFVFAGLVFAVETQTRWWKPNLTSVGWWVGFWNTVGGIGFWLTGIFGVWNVTDKAHPDYLQHWGTAFSTFWSSWAFFIGSYVQLLESLNKWT